MTAITSHFIAKAVEFIGGEFPDWTVEAYRGDLELAADVSYPYVSVAFEGATYARDEDLGAARLYMRARLVCYLVQKHESADSFTQGFDHAADLMSYLEKRSFHDASQQTEPLDIDPVPETLPNGQPRAGRSVWSVSADATLLIEERGALSEREFRGLPDAYPLGQPLNKVNLRVGAMEAEFNG